MHYTGMPRSNGANDLIARIVHADEHLDAAAFVEVLAPNATFRLGSAPPAAGTAAIAAFVEGLFARLRELRHAIGASWESDGMLAYEGVVHYTFRDGTRVTIPYANVLRLAGPLVSDYRIYLDPGPIPHPAFV